MPVYTGLANVGFFANLGLPGLAGFVGEVMVLIGSFGAARSDGILYQKFAAMGSASLDCFLCSVYTLSVIACFGVVLSAGYMLWTIQRVYLGPEKSEYKSFPEVDARELTVLTPLAVFAILLGVLPTVFVFVFTNQTVGALFSLFKKVT
jgi:NADH-quinone oxidoreductase subunit M